MPIAHPSRNLQFAVVVCLVSSCPGCAPTIADAPEAKTPIRLVSSADFGCLPARAMSVTRLVKIGNFSDAAVSVDRWSVSCECLSVEPRAVALGPAESTYVRLRFDPTKENGNFVGDLKIIVTGLAGQGHVCAFEVPVSVVPIDDLKDHEKKPKPKDGPATRSAP
jgi:hypothetical protein